jgi:diguanylate cyclase (GGDEF)-like protein/PAS domain S-box-containing protein
MDEDSVTPIWCSESITRLLGYSSRDALSANWWTDHLHDEDRQRVLSEVSRLRRTGSLLAEYRFVRSDGEVVWIRDEARLVGAPDGAGTDAIGTWCDITRQRAGEERVRLLAAALESTRDGVMIMDTDGRIVSVNRSLRETTGFSDQELLGKTPALLRSRHHASAAHREILRALAVAGHWEGEVWSARKDRSDFPAWLTVSAVRDELGHCTHYVAVYTDISKLKQNEIELDQLAHFDTLTGLPNRALLNARLEHALEKSRRHGDCVAVLFIDLDDFKKINDSLGHAAGDELLVAAAQRLKKRVRDEDTLARLGGDDFVVLVEALEQTHDAARIARDISELLAAPFRLSTGHELYLQASIGISVVPDDGECAADLLRGADTALYRAKADGGGIAFCTGDMSTQARCDLELEGALRQALFNDEFHLAFQPKVDMQTGRISGAEALLRWNRPGHGAVSPASFIPLAERTGLIAPIGRWVIAAACRQMRDWLNEGLPPVAIAVNVSARQFRSDDLRANIVGALRQYDIPPHALELELTESMLVERPEEATDSLRQLKEIGVRLSLDDFGTGFSSLAYLIRFPIDTLKIDRSFVGNMEVERTAMVVVNSIIELARRIGLHVVAEGVETAGQFVYLQARGCNEMQGYFFSKPLPAAEFAELFRSM